MAPGAKISQLHWDPNGTLGILHFPSAFLQPQPDALTNTVEISVEFKAVKSGKYKVKVFRDRTPQSSATRQLEAGQDCPDLALAHVGESEAIFLRITRLDDEK